MQHKNLARVGTGALTLAAGAFFLVSYVTLAQTSPTAESAQTGDRPAASQAGDDAGDSAAPERSAPAIDQAFEDYEASEQISEDLSVAFPVDI